MKYNPNIHHRRSNKNVGANPCGCPNNDQYANNSPKTIMNNIFKKLKNEI